MLHFAVVYQKISIHKGYFLASLPAQELVTLFHRCLPWKSYICRSAKLEHPSGCHIGMVSLLLRRNGREELVPEIQTCSQWGQGDIELLESIIHRACSREHTRKESSLSHN